MWSASTFATNNVDSDANGNITWLGSGRTFVYNPLNRLTQAYNLSTLLATYGYNGLGQRTRKTLADGTTTEYLYGLNGELLAERDASGTVQAEYVYLNNRPLAMILDPAGNSRIYYVQNRGQRIIIANVLLR